MDGVAGRKCVYERDWVWQLLDSIKVWVRLKLDTFDSSNRKETPTSLIIWAHACNVKLIRLFFVAEDVTTETPGNVIRSARTRTKPIYTSMKSKKKKKTAHEFYARTILQRLQVVLSVAPSTCGVYVFVWTPQKNLCKCIALHIRRYGERTR